MRALAASLVAAAAFAGCGPVQQATGRHVGAPPIEVVATTGMIADAVENVGGDRVEVTALMGPGIDPHLYRASEGDVQLLGGADLVVFNGLHLEAKLGEVLARLEGRAVAVGERIPAARRIRAPGATYDPHVWFDVQLWGVVVEAVRDALVGVDPAGRDVYERGAERHLAELRELHRYVRAQVARVPAERRVLVTAHDAFGYFGRAYGFEVLGLQGISTVSEAGTADIRELADTIAERRIPALFVETSVSPRAIEALRAAVRSRGFEVAIGGALFSDAMGDDGTRQGTYVGMVRHNVDTLVAGLRGEGEQ
ncbi:MAG: zinc ABC transporter substrate-binding protein [Thermoleophilia bacterium]|nr:zinc ABC transporter substrate-binding protein [Thermoleophilia bacterium]